MLEKEGELRMLIEQIHPKEEARLEACIREAQDAVSETESLLQAAREDLSGAEHELTLLTEMIHAQQSELRCTEYWTKGFKQIRLFLIDDALKRFEWHVNQTLGELGLRDWSIKCLVEREKKTGGVTKGFTVEVRSPSMSRPMPWESWSGGETATITIGRANWNVNDD